MDYADFIRDKQQFGALEGFEPVFIPDVLFDFQKHLTRWAVRKGRAAIFADCGLGKTLMQLVWAQNVVQKTGKSVLVLTPLAVSGQTLEEADKFNIAAHRGGERDHGASIYVTNYERLHHFDYHDYAGIVCDESSILKNFNGIRRTEITEFMRHIQYRLLCTATAAPNDWEELGTSSEALGYLGYVDMLRKFFTNKNNTVATRRFRNQREKWRLRAHAESDFWCWVTSWARAVRRPSDIGYDDNGFILPKLIERNHQIEASNIKEGMLFEIKATGFHDEREVIRRTIPDRCAAAADIVGRHNVSMVWCNLNDEAHLLNELIPDSVEISGSDSEEKKIEAAHWFVHGDDERRVLISKPSIFGFGMNFQHCHHTTYFPTHSYERYYQATRRLWRFGQQSPVVVDRIYTDGSASILENLARKSNNADKMFSDLVAYMNDSMQIKNEYQYKRTEVPQWMQ